MRSLVRECAVPQGRQASGEMALKILAVATPLDARALPSLVRKHLGTAA